MAPTPPRETARPSTSSASSAPAPSSMAASWAMADVASSRTLATRPRSNSRSNPNIAGPSEAERRESRKTHSLTFTEGTETEDALSATEKQQSALYHKRWLDQLDNRPLNFQGYLPNLAPLIGPDSDTYKPSAPVDAFTKRKRASTRRSASMSDTDGASLFDDQISEDLDINEIDYYDPEEDPTRTCWQRYFTFPGVFNLASATLGAGALALPSAMSTTGLPLGLALLVFMCLVTIYSISLLIQVADKLKLYSYEEISVRCFGKRFGLLVEVNIILFCFGAAVSYIIAAAQIVSPLVFRAICGSGSGCDNASVPHWLIEDGSKPGGWLYRIVCLGFTTVVMFPLSLIDKMNNLRFTSFIGVGSICYLIFAISADSISKSSDWNMDEVVGSDISAQGVLFSVPTIMFAFTCQVNVFSIYQELHNPTAERINKIGWRACMMSCFLYALIGAFGFMRFSDLKYDWNTANGNILNNYELGPSHGHHGNGTTANSWDRLSFEQIIKTPAVVLGEGAITITILLAFPLNVFPCRYTIEMIMDGHDEDELAHTSNANSVQNSPGKGMIEENAVMGDLASPLSLGASQHLLSQEEKGMQGGELVAPPQKCGRHFLLTAAIVGLAMVLAMYLPNIQVVFGILGSTCSAFVCYIVPAMFVLKTEEGPWYGSSKIMPTMLMVGGAITGIVCTTIIIYQTVTT